MLVAYCFSELKMLKNISANIWFGRDFSSDISCHGFFFNPFSVGMSLQEISGRSCLFRKNGGECPCKDFVW